MTDRSNPSAGRLDALLRAGIAAARAGQRDRAQELLTQVVQQDEQNVTAWLWLSGVTEDPANREACLQQVLLLDPDNEAARRGLDQVRRQRLDKLLRDGIAAAKLGQRDHARNLLTQYVEQDDRHAAAWLWLSGVVSTPEDREVCLENVLAIDPANEAARRGLSEVREEMEIEAAVAAQAMPTLTPLEPRPTDDGAASAESWEAILPGDRALDEYRCPYCGTQTGTKDSKCPACRRALEIKTRKREERSVWLWMALSMQVGTAALFLTTTAIVLMVAGMLSGVHDLGTLLRVYFGMTGGIDPAVVAGILDAGIPRPAVIAPFLYFAYAAGVALALFLRWKPAWYLYVASAVLSLLLSIGTLLVGLGQYGGMMLACSGVNVLLAFSMLWLVFQMQDDFSFARTRILLRPDREAVGGLDFLAHGSRYAKQGMWALAALHLERAAGAMPNQIEPHLALAAAQIQLKQYDRAAASLAEARRIDPGHARITELGDLLAGLRGA